MVSLRSEVGRIVLLVLPTPTGGLGNSLEMEDGLASAMMPVALVSIWLPDLRIISNKEDEVMALPSAAVGTYASSSTSLGLVFSTVQWD